MTGSVAGAAGPRLPAQDRGGAPRGPVGTTPDMPRPAVRAGVASRLPMAPDATIVGRWQLSPTVVRIAIRPDGARPLIEAGQYLALGVPNGDRLLQRPYSAALVGDDGAVEFLIRLVPWGVFTPRLWALGVGARLHLGPPRGLFRLMLDDGRTHLLVAAGTGLAPLMAMAAALRERAHPPPTFLVHGVARMDELAYRQRLDAWQAQAGLRYLPVVSRPEHPTNAGWTGHRGHVDAVIDSICAAGTLDPASTVAYLCGNPGMIVATRDVLLRRGLPPTAMVSEAYWTDLTT